MIALTLALYVTLYIALVIAYVAVLKYMAEKPEEVLARRPRRDAGRDGRGAGRRQEQGRRRMRARP